MEVRADFAVMFRLVLADEFRDLAAGEAWLRSAEGLAAPSAVRMLVMRGLAVSVQGARVALSALGGLGADW